MLMKTIEKYPLNSEISRPFSASSYCKYKFKFKFIYFATKFT